MPLDLRHAAALTFDCYGTLIDWESGLLAQLRPWAERHRVAAGDEALLEAFAERESYWEAARPEWPYPKILTAVFQDLARRFAVEPSDEEAAAFAASVGDWPAFADTPAALAYLCRFYKLVIVSNIDRGSFERSATRLGARFDAVVTAEDVGAYKPDRKMFDAAFGALARLGVEPPRILHVAQSLFHDHVPAKTLGLKTVWVDRRAGRPGGATSPPMVHVEPDLVVSSLGELVELHRRLLEPAR